MICKNCGKEIVDDSRFCNYCGVAQPEHKGNTTDCSKGHTDCQRKKTLLTRKQAIFWGLYLLYTVGWLLTYFNEGFPTTYEKVRAVLLWILPLLFVVAKRSMKNFVKK